MVGSGWFLPFCPTGDCSSSVGRLPSKCFAACLAQRTCLCQGTLVQKNMETPYCQHMASYVPWRNEVPGVGAPGVGRGLGQDKEETSFFWGVRAIPGGPRKKGRCCREDKALLGDQTVHLQVLPDLRKREREEKKEEEGKGTC